MKAWGYRGVGLHCAGEAPTIGWSSYHRVHKHEIEGDPRDPRVCGRDGGGQETLRRQDVTTACREDTWRAAHPSPLCNGGWWTTWNTRAVLLAGPSGASSPSRT